MKYLLKDNLCDTEKVINEKDLRDLYNFLLDDLICMNCLPQDEDYRQNIYKEKEEVYKIDIQKVIAAITDIDRFYEIKESEE